MKQANKTDEPPSCLQPPIFLIGRNSRGNWVVQEQGGACGGLFVDREAALKFAKSENGNHSHAVVWVSDGLELDTGPVSPIASEQQLASDAAGLRRVA
jgi:hypothetical protein